MAKGFQDSGQLQLLGVIEEQHPSRCRLFNQWHRLDYPMLVDTLNLLQLTVVPQTYGIDEAGIIREVFSTASPERALLEQFLSQSFDPKDDEAISTVNTEVPEEIPESSDPEVLREYAHRALLWGGVDRLDHGIEALEQSVILDPQHGPTLFRLGAGYRMRYDSELRRRTDFQNAVAAWDRALLTDPNNYIWRRRIQQYGPHLEKPYRFYDWVSHARDEIQARGETPVVLDVEPRGTELATEEGFLEESKPVRGPDPGGRVLRDPGRFVISEVAVVPPAVSPGATARVHLVFRPNPQTEAHWNNEMEDLEVWFEPPDGWQIEQYQLRHPGHSSELSKETRHFEFEVRAPEARAARVDTLSGYALYYICENADGVCLYRRQDLPIRLEVREKSP